MAIKEKHKITPTQLTFFVIQTMVGVGVLTLPYSVHQWARGGAWISTILAGVLSQVLIIIQWALCKRHPNHTLYGIFMQLSGRWIGMALAVSYIVYFILICDIILIRFEDIVGRWALPETPRWVIFLLLAGTGLYLAKENTRIVARFNVPVTYMIVVFVILILLSYSNADIRYTLPITEAGWDDIIKASHKAYIAMIGYEVMMILFPFLSGSNRQILKAVSLGNWLVVAFYTFATFSSLIVFAPQEMVLIPEPLLYMMKAYDLRVIERIDLIFLSLWVVSVFTSYVAYIHMAAIGVQELLGDKVNTRRKSAGWIILTTYLLALFISDPATVKMLDDWVSHTGYLFFGGIPLLFLMISKLRGKERRKA